MLKKGEGDWVENPIFEESRQDGEKGRLRLKSVWEDVHNCIWN